jgi:hypothetical protein
MIYRGGCGGEVKARALSGDRRSNARPPSWKLENNALGVRDLDAIVNMETIK